MKMEKPKKEFVSRMGGSLLGISVIGLLIPIFYMKDNGFSGSEILFVGTLGLVVILVLAVLTYCYLEN